MLTLVPFSVIITRRKSQLKITQNSFNKSNISHTTIGEYFQTVCKPPKTVHKESRLLSKNHNYSNYNKMVHTRCLSSLKHKSILNDSPQIRIKEKTPIKLNFTNLETKFKDYLNKWKTCKTLVKPSKLAFNQTKSLRLNFLLRQHKFSKKQVYLHKKLLAATYL